MDISIKYVESAKVCQAYVLCWGDRQQLLCNNDDIKHRQPGIRS